jgi:trimethylamine--corrinoid protein Co-methyltransferase
LLDQKPIASWESSGKKTMEDRVREKVVDIMEKHTPEPLDDKVVAELDRLRREADKEIRSKVEKG